MHPHAANYFVGGKPPKLTGNVHPNLAPYEIYPARKTGSIFLGVGNDGTFRKLCNEIGKPELGADPRFARNKDRLANQDGTPRRTDRGIQPARCRAFMRSLARRRSAGRPRAAIDQALASAHTVHRGDVVERDWYKGVASPIRFDRSKASLRNLPPKFSEHAGEVLTEFGYSSGEIDALVKKGVVCGPERKR